jgi:hypothetical protein
MNRKQRRMIEELGRRLERRGIMEKVRDQDGNVVMQPGETVRRKSFGNEPI